MQVVVCRWHWHCGLCDILKTLFALIIHHSWSAALEDKRQVNHRGNLYCYVAVYRCRRLGGARRSVPTEGGEWRGHIVAAAHLQLVSIRTQYKMVAVTVLLRILSGSYWWTAQVTWHKAAFECVLPCFKQYFSPFYSVLICVSFCMPTKVDVHTLVFRHLNEQNFSLFTTLSEPMSNIRTFQYPWETCIYIDSHI